MNRRLFLYMLLFSELLTFCIHVYISFGLDLYVGSEEVEGMEEDSRAEVSCPFCAEDFDIVGLCCHIDDEHSQEANSGECFNLGQLHRTCFVQSALLGSSHLNTLDHIQEEKLVKDIFVVLSELSQLHDGLAKTNANMEVGSSPSWKRKQA